MNLPKCFKTTERHSLAVCGSHMEKNLYNSLCIKERYASFKQPAHMDVSKIFCVEMLKYPPAGAHL